MFAPFFASVMAVISFGKIVHSGLSFSGLVGENGPLSAGLGYGDAEGRGTKMLSFG